MPRKRKTERNKALYTDWMSGNYRTYKDLALKYGIDASNAYKMVKREKEELIQQSGIAEYCYKEAFPNLAKLVDNSNKPVVD